MGVTEEAQYAIVVDEFGEDLLNVLPRWLRRQRTWRKEETEFLDVAEGRRELVSASCSLTSTQMLRHVHTHTHR